MDEHAIERWRDAIAHSGLPAHAEIRHVRDGDAVRFEIDWATNDDPERENKRSRTLRIDVSSSGVREYRKLDQAKAAADSAFRGLVARCVDKFDPANDLRSGEVPPPHHCVVDVDELIP